ncbi:hypothetical protein [Bacillus toyonensis]|uniref:hypothetical protein n=1 Tax=Bacillus toyonensis TaxID=155322 RepID=UPI0025408D34|nr:hypothetical protein [Bacillus toyonensis]
MLSTVIYGEEVVKNVTEGYYGLIICALVNIFVLFLYKAARNFISNIWSISSLKTTSISKVTFI